MSDASFEQLISGLADELEPVQPRRVARGLLWVSGGWMVGVALLLWFFGTRSDLAHGDIPALPMLAFWVIAAVGLASIWSALRMGMPGVGRDYSGWRWAGLVALALPLSALLFAMGDSHAAIESARIGVGSLCFTQSALSGLGVGAVLVFWLRRSAPTSPTRAGLVVGIAAGASGATMVALTCPFSNIIHIALWHGLAVIVSGLAGRLLLPPLLRW